MTVIISHKYALLLFPKYYNCDIYRHLIEFLTNPHKIQY